MALIITRDRQRKGNLLSRLQFTSHDFFFCILVAILERLERESFIQQKLHSHGSRAPRMHARRNVIAKGFQLGRSYSPYDRYGTIQHYRVIISISFFRQRPRLFRQIFCSLRVTYSFRKIDTSWRDAYRPSTSRPVERREASSSSRSINQGECWQMPASVRAYVPTLARRHGLRAALYESIRIAGRKKNS